MTGAVAVILAIIVFAALHEKFGDCLNGRGKK